MIVAISWSVLCHSLGLVSKIVSEAEFALMCISLSLVKKLPPLTILLLLNGDFQTAKFLTVVGKIRSGSILNPNGFSQQQSFCY